MALHFLAGSPCGWQTQQERVMRDQQFLEKESGTGKAAAGEEKLAWDTFRDKGDSRKVQITMERFYFLWWGAWWALIGERQPLLYKVRLQSLDDCSVNSC